MLRKVEKDNKNNLWDIYSGLLGWAGVGVFGWICGNYRGAIIIAIMASTYAY